ncbi:MAG: 16S rRNA (guanine(527)-N(7))-methyltransferase RsmG [Treponema sp.]|nr:16S rRNA (guanine(527)-N(7))-methyltransferase RsmG [Treponema sp.]
MADILQEGLASLNFSKEEVERISPLIEQYIGELRLFNSAYNLVNTDDHDEIVIRHILDSLAANFKIMELAAGLKTNLAKDEIIIGDIGTGGGLPGIPLAIANPDQKFVFVERMNKRCAFLENCCAILGLSNVTVKNLEAEKVPAQSIDLATFRAFRPLDKKMISTLLNMLPAKGLLAAYKAKKEKIVEEMTGINYSADQYSIEPLEVPFLTKNARDNDDRERNLVVIRK